MLVIFTLLNISLMITEIFSKLPLRSSNVYKNYTLLMMADNLIVCGTLKRHLCDWHFSEPKILQLPLDEVKENYVRRNVHGAVFSLVKPTPLKDLKLVAYSKDVLVNILDMDPSIASTQDFVEFVAGNKILDSCTPTAHRYGGHQFGVWAMQLGDGRAHLLGEYINSQGEHWELQLKGSGLTPYSRGGDGRAVLRSSIREFLCSEAMHYLGIPTTRAAALVVSHDHVMRDRFYNGFPEQERTAVVLRLAPTWFRFGSLELLTLQNEVSTLQMLTDYIIKEHFIDINPQDTDRYLQMYSIVSHKTIDLVVQWQCVGFTHGVLNTDNMSLMSVTIDYGPFGFMEAYQPAFVPNSSDKEGRYSYTKQIEIVLWNLKKLAIALMPLVTESQKSIINQIHEGLKDYAEEKLTSGFRSKLGLLRDLPGDSVLVTSLLQLMQSTAADFTMVFRQLGELKLEQLMELHLQETTSCKSCNMWALQQLVKQPEQYATFMQAYSRRLSDEGLTDAERCSNMAKQNPRYVLRNWMAQSAIAHAENDDFSEVALLLHVLSAPYTFQQEAENRGYAAPPPAWASTIRVSCSS